MTNNLSDNNIDNLTAEDGQLELIDLGDEFGAEADDVAEDVRNAVRMLVVRVDGENVNATPVLFSMGETGAEPMEDAPDDANEFFDMVSEDMGDMLVQLIQRTEESGMTRADAMIQLLTDMQAQPQELIHNILGCMIVNAAFMSDSDDETDAN